MKILVVGASGFIGSRLVRALAAQGHHVVGASRSREPHSPLWAFVRVDFAQVPEPAWWVPQLQGIDVVINAVGIFRESASQTFEALHHRAPVALFAACALAEVPRVIQLSALGSDHQAATAYHLSKRAADEALRGLPVTATIVQPSLVYAPQGASARFFNQLAVLPVLALPEGALVQPVHIDDVVRGILALVAPAPAALPQAASRTLAFVGPVPLTLRHYLAELRQALGLARPAAVLELPGRLCLALAAVAGRFPAGFVDRDAVSMLLRGNVADPEPFTRLLGHPPRPVASFFAPDMAPSLRQEAVLGWMLPLMNLSVALVWIWTGIVSLGLYPVAGSLRLLADFGLHGGLAKMALYSAAVLDLALGVLTLTARGRLRRWVLAFQLLVIAAYTLMITVRLPEWWLHPYGPISKNLPMVLVIVLLLALVPPSRSGAGR
ncbi:MAG: hypothetical protein JWP79_2169 [Polaromonas sp.]|jgi:uncharacterized protein YbjT (DUF2867 family)|nr:hypothetical protein [Polaromonas sp.]MDB5844859.1 hypothetical protein [Polaromonas sp.]MDB5938766.1 hypothetical protein [Polaromonas sp.]